MKMQKIALIALIVSTKLHAGQELEQAQARKANAEATLLEAQAEAQKKGIVSAANAQACEAEKTKRKNAAKSLFGTYEELPEGTSATRKCMDITFGGIRYLYGKNKRDVSWNTIIEANDDVISATQECAGDKFSIQAYEAAKNNAKASLIKCDTAAYVISKFNRDWENPEHAKQLDVKEGTPPITCTGKGVATFDYDGCVKFVQNGNIMDAAQKAINQGQELYYADKTMDAQAAAAKSDNTATAALEAMKSGVKSQKEILEQRAAMDTGKLAILAQYYADMPSIDEVREKCNSYTQPGDLSGPDARAICNNNISKNDFGFLMNQMAKEKMKAKLVQVGINVGSQAVMADLLAKREGDLNNAIAKVDSFKPIDPVAPQANNMQTTYCQTNPGDPKCLTGGLDRTFDTMNDNVITFGDGGTGTTYANANPFKDTTTTNTNAVSPTSRNSITGVGSTIAAANQGSGLANPIAAGTITKGNGPTGGGGGGGASGGGGGGGGGGAPASAQGQGGVSAAIQGKTPIYNGGGGFSILGGGGLKMAKKGNEKEENPFGKLFGKNQNTNGAINFRDPASLKVGSKGDNIFDMISKRYSSVSSDKRLLEYELAK